jgi:hypothetical protein
MPNPNATQSAKPSAFMPALANYLATSLQMNRAQVKIIAPESEKILPNKAEKQISLMLDNPTPVNVNDGAGRYGFKMSRKLVVTVTTRNVSDRAGQDEIALLQHWDFQDQIQNFLLLTIENLGVTPVPFALPIKYVGGGDNVEKSADEVPGLYESVLVFELSYISQVQIPTP